MQLARQYKKQVDKRVTIRYNSRTGQWFVLQGIQCLEVGTLARCRAYCKQYGLTVGNEAYLDCTVAVTNK